MFSFFTKKKERAEMFASSLELITDKGIIDARHARVGMNVLGFENGKSVINKIEEVTDETQYGNFYMVNDSVLLFENQSVFANGNITHAKLLKTGHILWNTNGKTYASVPVVSIKKVTGRFHFYRFKISGNHTYFLNGLLMHNASRYWVAAPGQVWNATAGTKWAATSGGAGGSSNPTSADDVFFNGSSGSSSVAIGPATCNSFNSTGFAGSFTAGTTGLTVAGSITLGVDLVVPLLTMSATATGKTITCNGYKIIAASSGIIFSGVGGGWTLQDDFYGSQLNINNGAFVSNGYLIDLQYGTAANGVVSNNSNVRSIDISNSTVLVGGGTWNLANTNNLTLTTTGSLIKVVSTSSTFSFSGGGKTYNNVWFSRGSNTNNITITGTNTFNDLKDDGTGAHTIIFPNVTTTVSTFTVNGADASTHITLARTGASGTFTLSAASGTINAQYVTISNSTATGGATWNAVDSTDNGGNTGWNFISSSLPSAGFLMFFDEMNLG